MKNLTLLALLLLATPVALLAQDPPPTVQPGAPGEDARVLDPDALDGAETPEYTEADVAFMRGMIPHHAQALEMVELLWDRTESRDMRQLGLRIEISQKDEIAMMQRWLTDRGEDLPGGPHNMGMDGTMVMPGMLTPAQMQELADANGTQFDRLFLEYMISHHVGALTMVGELFGSPGAAQVSAVWHFAHEVDADQEMEIRRMRGMLERLP